VRIMVSQGGPEHRLGEEVGVHVEDRTLILFVRAVAVGVIAPNLYIIRVTKIWCFADRARFL
jgi:hypothetical protein